MVRYVQITIANLRVKLFIVLPSVRELATEKSKQENTRSVNISRWAAKLRLLHNLGSHVARGPAKDFYFLLVGYASRKPEIYELYIIALVKHDVLQLYIPMCYTLGVEVIQGIYELSINLPSVILSHAPIGLAFQEPVCRASGYVLQYQDNLLLSLYRFI